MIKLTKIDIISGFLGAGKTTLIKKLIDEAYRGEKIVLIENEFGEIGIDGGFLQDSGVQINEMNSGCICCSLVGDFSRALTQVLEKMAPERIIIEPSGVGKLSDVIRAVRSAVTDGVELNSFTTVADVSKCKMYMKNFGEFYNDQVANAGCIVLSHTGKATDKKIAECVALIREHNKNAVIVTTDWGMLSGADLVAAMEQKDTLAAELEHLAHEAEHHHHHHDGECTCGEHHHHHDEHCECGEHHHGHHHHHDEECTCGEHHHHDEEHCGCGEHHHHAEHCDCGCGEHHHGHHHADDVFTSWGKETTRKFTKEELEAVCAAFDEDSETYGIILRAKGIVEAEDGKWLHFDYVPGETNVRYGTAGLIGRLCVIGSGISEEKLEALFAKKENA